MKKKEIERDYYIKIKKLIAELTKLLNNFCEADDNGDCGECMFRMGIECVMDSTVRKLKELEENMDDWFSD